MRMLTWREYLARLEWIDAQWERLDKADNYRMQIAYEVRRSWMRDPGEFSDMKIKFRDPDCQDTDETGMSLEQATALAKSAWATRVPLDQRGPSFPAPSVEGDER